MRNSFELGLDHLGRKMGGLPVEVIYEDDGQKPEQGLQKTQKLIESDKVDFVIGYIWSNVLLASYKPVIDSQTFLISTNAGPHQIAGDRCSPWFFSTSWQNDQTPQAMAHYMNEKGVKTLYLLGPNYAAGRDMLGGVTSVYKGKVVGQDLTKWPDQLDFSAELSKVRAAKPDALFAFYPGAPGVQFLNAVRSIGPQGSGAALHCVHDRLRSRCNSRKSSRSASPAPSSGSTTCRMKPTRNTCPSFAPSTRTYPTFYGAQTYDAAAFINSAVVAVKGDLSKKDAIRDELRKANYASVRGKYRYDNNHFPIQNFYLQDVVKDADGNLTLEDRRDDRGRQPRPLPP